MPQDKRMCFKAFSRLLAEVGQSLRHPARVEILEMLSGGAILTHDQIASRIHPLTSGTVGHHLDRLHKSDYLERVVVNSVVVYAINQDTISEAEQLFSRFMNKIRSD